MYRTLHNAPSFYGSLFAHLIQQFFEFIGCPVAFDCQNFFLTHPGFTVVVLCLYYLHPGYQHVFSPPPHDTQGHVVHANVPNYLQVSGSASGSRGHRPRICAKPFSHVVPNPYSSPFRFCLRNM